MKNTLTTLLTILLTVSASAEGLYSQLLISVPAQRKFQYSHQVEENALVLEIENTSPEELKALEQYDERLIKRVLIKDLGAAGCEVRFVLRDRRVRASIYRLSEPPRIAIDLYDADYHAVNDPVTGLPLVLPKEATVGSADRLLKENISNFSESVQAEKLTLENPSNTSRQAQAVPTKRLLVSPGSEPVADQLSLTNLVKDAPDGLGKAWKTYPSYIYRLQTAAYEEGLATDKEIPPPNAALSSVEAMADYAGKLYNFGHEAKALVVYQQVLHRDPRLFDRDALHLWKFAETNFAQGNLTLARGYYQAVLEKHPESAIAQFAKLRALDVAAIRMMAQGKQAELTELLPRLEQIKTRANGELAALIGIRQAYWAQAPKDKWSNDLPPIDGEPRPLLAAAYPNTESSRTALLASSLILNDMLRPQTAWERSYGKFAEGYFKRFTGSGSEPYRTNLKNTLHAKISENLQKKVNDGRLLEAIDDFESLPDLLKSVAKEAKNAWSLAEAYRKLNQQAKAVEYYGMAVKGLEDGPDRFKANFWLSVTAGNYASDLRIAKAGSDQIERYQNISAKADRDSGATWERLKDDERNGLATALKDALEKTVNDPPKLRTPAKIVLNSWNKALSTRVTTTAGTAVNEWQKNFSPSAAAVLLITDLAKRFAEMGMIKERRESLSLLKQMKPSDFEDDANAKETWASQLLSLAEDRRRANDFLEAGRLFSLVGKEAENFSGRAEALYKGGLLLFRTGRRDEAIASFKEAAADGNNLFYANLAKERLSQIEQ